ncbi:SLC13 family permease [Rubrivirga marina]|uniref:SLC13 family permease n=1 Tax=Rubrivirga marina TaxID=1196024 RepID=A0A271IZM8_9BACT|nr:SLC13 family permease [Rubrivirga marina]PAP75949.1 SLC13 family permease [Rubrivirga marina]
MGGLTWAAWATLAVVGAMLYALVRDLARADLVLVGAVGVLVALGVLSPQDAFAGFANPAVIAVASLFVLAAGVQNTGALGFADRALFPRQGGLTRSVAQMGGLLGVMSAVLNNTPIVAMVTPRAQAWCERAGIPPSKVLMFVAYSTTVGGTLTLIGTSTNLVVTGRMAEAGLEPLGMFTQTPVALPAALAALAVMALVSHRFLPGRRAGDGPVGDGLGRCLFEVRVPTGSPLVGQTIEEAGLRSLETAYLVHLRRDDDLVPATPESALRAGDTLTFQGSARALDGLLDRPGLARAVEPVSTPLLETLPLYEAVVAESSSLVGRTLREAEFRERYGGVVLAIQRADDALTGRLGRTPLHSGDLLVVEAANGFEKEWNARRDEFYLVAPRRPERPRPQPRKAPLALAILGTVIALAAAGIVPIDRAAFVGALAMIATRCLRGRDAREAVQLPTLVVIAMALGVGKALETTGLAVTFADAVVGVAGPAGPFGVLMALYLVTVVLTELITNNAAAALMIGMGLEAAAQAGVSPTVFGVAIALAASSGFLTPFGYQTNLMVMSAGGYRFADYVRAGAPVSLVYSATALLTMKLLWF